jgi:hypothetical protein
VKFKANAAELVTEDRFVIHNKTEKSSKNVRRISIEKLTNSNRDFPLKLRIPPHHALLVLRGTSFRKSLQHDQQLSPKHNNTGAKSLFTMRTRRRRLNEALVRRSAAARTAAGAAPPTPIHLQNSPRDAK